MAVLDYIEDVGDYSPNSAGFSLETAEATSVYQVLAPAAADLEGLPLAILGGVVYDPGDGRLQRTPPLAHPVWPWLYASTIKSIQGVGYKNPDTGATAARVAVNPKLEAVAVADFFWLYPLYRVTIGFTNRPYPVAPDTSVSKLTGTWFYEGIDGTSGQVAATATAVTFPYSTEYDRWTDIDIDPKEQAVTAQQGCMRFVSKSPVVSAQVFSGQPRMTLPNRLLRLVWYGVPYRYFLSDNSYFSKWVGRINQNAIRLCGKTFAAGSLLYLGAKPRKYTPPVVELDTYSPGVFSTSKWMNIELSFLETTRSAADLPTAAFSGSTFSVLKQTVSGATITAGTGTITSSGTAVTGSGTLFSTEVAKGDYIGSTTTSWVQVAATPASNTSLATLTIPGLPGNANFIQSGWNLFPWVVDRHYHYATSVPKSATGSAFVQPTPAFLSFPVELLFYDPDASDALQVAGY